MSFESLLLIPTVPAIHAKPDVGRVTPDGQSKRENGGARQKSQEERPHPVPNEQGQVTGKLIDTTA